VVTGPALRLAIGLALIVGAAPSGAEAPSPEAKRCAERIALFDELIQSRFDYRILKLENYELDEARRLRLRAGAYCAERKFEFGLAAIDAALERIGALPLAEDDRPPDQP
jgi:hypothetical protein